MWKRLAGYLGVPLQRLQAETTSSEFSRWMIFLEQEEVERIRKEEFYYAAMIAEVRRSWVATQEDREKIKNSDFLIRPKKARTVGERKKSTAPKTKKQKQEYLKKSKGHWFGICGLNKEKKDV